MEAHTEIILQPTKIYQRPQTNCNPSTPGLGLKPVFPRFLEHRRGDAGPLLPSHKVTKFIRRDQECTHFMLGCSWWAQPTEKKFNALICQSVLHQNQPRSFLQSNFQDTRSFNEHASGTIHLHQCFFKNIHEGKVLWRSYFERPSHSFTIEILKS